MALSIRANAAIRQSVWNSFTVLLTIQRSAIITSSSHILSTFREQITYILFLVIYLFGTFYIFHVCRVLDCARPHSLSIVFSRTPHCCICCYAIAGHPVTPQCMCVPEVTHLPADRHLRCFLSPEFFLAKKPLWKVKISDTEMRRQHDKPSVNISRFPQYILLVLSPIWLDALARTLSISRLSEAKPSLYYFTDEHFIVHL